MPIDLKRLILTRQLLDSAEAALAHSDDVSMLKGVLLADLAAETLLKGVLDEMAIKPKSDKFDVLIDAVVEAGTNAKKDFSSARGTAPLRQLRNPAQHGAVVPRREEARARFAQCRDSLKALCVNVFGVDLANLRALDFIRDADVGGLLVEAAKDSAAGDHHRALGGCIAAFESLLVRWTEFNQRLFGLKEGPNDKFAQIISTLSAGVYLPDLMRFREVTAGVTGQLAMDGKLKVITDGSGLAATPESVSFALDFVADVALHLEATLPVQPKP